MSEASSESSSSNDKDKNNLDIKVKTLKNKRIFITSILPILPFCFLFFFLLTLFLTNLRINSGINRAFNLSPNSIVFKIDRRQKNISSDNLPKVKYDHSRKISHQGDSEQFYSQEYIRNIAQEIERYNDNLPDIEYKEDQIEKIVQEYNDDQITAYYSFN